MLQSGIRLTSKPMTLNEEQAQVFDEVSSWKGVTVHEHRFGGVEFRLGHRELGHMHRRFVDLPFPRSIRDELVAVGRARPHHVLPDSGWVTVPIRTDYEAEDAIELFWINYRRAVSTGAATTAPAFED